MNESKNFMFLLPDLYHENDDGFLVIAHRGASAYYPENTMAAFRGALEMNAEMIELDIMLSRDKVPVAFHDASLNRHTNGRGPVENLTVEELKRLDAGSWFDAAYSGERIPTLDEVLEFASGRIALNIEIKTEAVTDAPRNGVEEKCLDLVKKHGMERHVLFSSFDYRAVTHLKKLDPDIPVALLYNKRASGNLLPSTLLKKYKADAFNCNYFQLTKKRHRNLQSNGIPTFIYTVDNRKRMRRLLDMKVSGVFTNKPDLLNEVVSGYPG